MIKRSILFVFLSLALGITFKFALMAIISSILLYFLVVLYLFKNGNHISKGIIVILTSCGLYLFLNNIENLSFFLFVLSIIGALLSTKDNNGIAKDNLFNPLLIRKLRNYSLQKNIFIYFILILSYFSGAFFLISSDDDMQRDSKVSEVKTNHSENTEEKVNINMKSKNKHIDESEKLKGRLKTVLYLISVILADYSLILGLSKKILYELMILTLGIIGLNILGHMYYFGSESNMTIIFTFFIIIAWLVVDKYKKIVKETDEKKVPVYNLSYGKSVQKALQMIFRTYLLFTVLLFSLYIITTDSIPFYNLKETWFLVYLSTVLLILSFIALIIFKYKKDYKKWILLPASVIDATIYFVSMILHWLYFEPYILFINRALKYDLDMLEIE